MKPDAAMTAAMERGDWIAYIEAAYEMGEREGLEAVTADAFARAICRETCAFYGDPPCYKTGDWPNDACNEPGCVALGAAALEAALAAPHDPEARIAETP